MKIKLTIIFLLLLFLFNLGSVSIAKEEVNNGRFINTSYIILGNISQNTLNLTSFCKVRNITFEDCKNILEQTLKGSGDYPEKLINKIMEFELRKLKRNQEIRELEQNPLFAKPKLIFDFKSRIIEKAKIEEARKEIINTRFQIKESKVRLKNARSELNAAKKLEKACKNPDSEKCKVAKAKLFVAAQEHFLAQTDYIVKNLERIKSELQWNEDITDEEELKITIPLDNDIKIVLSIESKIRAAENKEQLLNAAEELKTSWNRIWSVTKKSAASLVSNRIASIVMQSKHLEKRLESILIKMAENGKDTSEVQIIIDNFYFEIESAKDSLEASQILLLGVKVDSRSDTETNTKIQQIQYNIKDSKEHLKKSRLLLAQIISNVDRDLLEMADKEPEVS